MRPDWLFDRSDEWARLTSFAQARGAGLAIVYGRRRQGKTSLVEAVTSVSDGFYWQARQQSSAQNLASVSHAIAQWGGLAATPLYQSWEGAFVALFALRGPGSSPLPVAIDEFGYLLETAPEVASIIQAQLTPASNRSGSTRLILCGSAFSQMRSLLAGDAPLRGRASLELVVGPFNYRLAAEYWGLQDNPRSAFDVHALVGGTPGYLPLAGAAPRRGDVRSWAIEHVLLPTSPLHREGRASVAEDAALGDRSLYWGLLAAVADGSARRSEIAEEIRRPTGALAFPLRVLLEAGWIEQRDDPLHKSRSSVLLTEPMVRTHRVLIEPEELRLARGQAAAVWDDASARVATLIHGPHLEWMACEWALSFADPNTLGGSPRLVGPSVWSYGQRRSQIDLVAVQPDARGADRVIAIGETKATASATGVDQLARLDNIVERLGDRGAPMVKRILTARAGFTAELRRTARSRPDVELVDLDRLYNGS